MNWVSIIFKLQNISFVQIYFCISENKHVYYCVTDCTMCYQNNVTCHTNPPQKICYQNGKKNFTQRKRKSKTQTSLLKEIFKSHIDWLIFFPILGQILGNKTLEKWFFSSILIMIGQSCFLRLSIDWIIFRSNRNFFKTSSRSQVIKINSGKWRGFQKIYLNSSVLKQI